MIEKIKKYINNDRSISSYTDTFIEWIAMSFLVMCTYVFWVLGTILLFVICPIWIVPYLIYKKVKKRGVVKNATTEQED